MTALSPSSSSGERLIAEGLILASASPRRSALLSMLGIPHRVIPPEGPEEGDAPSDPEGHVRTLAERKAGEVAGKVGEGVIVGADTVVVHRGRLWGKPRDVEEARGMLGALAGDWHHVHTGVAVVEMPTGRRRTACEVTAVKFRPFGPTETQRYLESGEPLDKAGAYGIQGYGAALVDRVEGCFFNVVGLPVTRLLALLAELGYEYGYPGLLGPGR